MRVRACIRCREYVSINPVDPVNQNIIKAFEHKHSGHNLVTVDIDEVKGNYTKVD